jgi:hypothetical protein
VVCLNYVGKNGKPSSGMVTIELEFSSSDSSINYLEVSYSDSEIEDLVESKPEVLRNIDSYLRNKLLKVEYNF